MSIPRPRICTRVTIPTGGWALQLDISQAAQYDTAIDVTVSAGDYFVSGDGQTDDLLYEIATQVMGDANWPALNAYFGATIDPETHKVKFLFCGDEFEGATKQDVRLDWINSVEVAQALGFAHDAVDELTGTDHPIATADYEVAYNWWASEDGQLEEILVEDVGMVQAIQAHALVGATKTQRIGYGYRNSLALQFVERNLALSGDVGYTTAPVYPYTRNRGLECWWKEAQKGIEFRVYRDHYIDVARAADRGTHTADTTTTMTDSGKSWGVEPQEFDNAVLYLPDWGENSAKQTIPMYYKITSNTATQLTVNAHPSGLDVMGNASAGTYYLFHHRYGTYVVDLKQMTEFEPRETADGLDEYSIRLPLRRYVA